MQSIGHYILIRTVQLAISPYIPCGWTTNNDQIMKQVLLTLISCKRPCFSSSSISLIHSGHSLGSIYSTRPIKTHAIYSKNPLFDEEKNSTWLKPLLMMDWTRDSEVLWYILLLRVYHVSVHCKLTSPTSLCYSKFDRFANISWRHICRVE